MRLVSWNIARQPEAWNYLARDDSIDVALLQEANEPTALDQMDVVSGRPFRLAGWKKRAFSTAVVDCSQRYDVRATPAWNSIERASADELGVSRPGSLALATVTGPDLAAPLVVVSVYAAWEEPVPKNEASWIYAVASAHRLISDLCALLQRQKDHRILVAGDWNILHGYGEDGSPYWAGRYRSVFDRMKTLGLQFVGPQQPNGQAATDPAAELPADSLDVPTYRTRRNDPRSARRQLDFVFASTRIAEAVTTTALNTPGAWGPSDHCRVRIDVNETLLG